MASIYFQIAGVTEGYNWSAKINVLEQNSEIFAAGPNSINIPPDGALIQYSGNYGANYNGGGVNGSYFTLRSIAPQGQYPYQGYSIDIWSETLTDAIAENNPPTTWITLVNAVPFSLSTEKFSLFYDYTKTYAPFWSKGGTIDFTS